MILAPWEKQESIEGFLEQPIDFFVSAFQIINTRQKLTIGLINLPACKARMNRVQSANAEGDT